MALIGILGHVVYQLCFIVGLDLTLAGNASLLLATTPVWTMVLSSWAGHERPEPRVQVRRPMPSSTGWGWSSAPVETVIRPSTTR